MRLALISFTYVLLLPLAAQQHLEVKSVFFGGGNWYVDELQAAELLDWLYDKPNLHEYDIYIHSHTDNIGGAEYNQWLSEMRSQSVLKVMTEGGVDADGIFIRDFGQHSPEFDNRTLHGRLQNRRVDVILVPPGS